MKLEPVTSKLNSGRLAPSYLKLDAKSGFYWVDIYRKGRGRLQRSTKKDTLTAAAKEAEKMVARFLGEEKDGSPLKRTFREVALEFMDGYEAKHKAGKIREGTIKLARLYIPKYLCDEFGPYAIGELTAGHWARYVAYFQKENPGKGLENHWKHMSLVMNYAYQCGDVKRPWSVENPDPKRRRGRILTDAEKTRLLEVAKPNLRDQLLMAMTMGMRLREILHLTWDRVEFEGKLIVLRPEDTKTKKGRVMKMSPDVADMLADRRRGYYSHGRGKSAQFVFPAKGDPSSPCEQNSSAWETAKRKAGIRGRCRFHDLRHTFLTECANKVRHNEVSVALVTAYCGLSIQVFDRVYLQLDHEDTSAVSEMIGVKMGFSKTPRGKNTNDITTYN